MTDNAFPTATRIVNPSQAALKELALKHTPALFETACGNLVKYSRNKARQAKYTYLIAPESDRARYSHNIMDRGQADKLIKRQAEYIDASGELIEVQGFLGLGKRAVGVQWLYTLEGANIAGMQSILAFSPSDVIGEADFEPTLRVVYTPDLIIEDIPGGQAIIVDLDNMITYIMGPDYFGESKKAALRMLNALAYDEGALVLHAGAKSVNINNSNVTMTIMGLSGTGKTTTTFSKQGSITQPIQDDMVTIWPGGELSITENGCFAKTFGLTEETEPVIYRGTISSEAWLENVYCNDDRTLNFNKGPLTPEEVDSIKDMLVTTGADPENIHSYITGDISAVDVTNDVGVIDDGWEFIKWTGNGRSIIPMSSVEDAADLNSIPPVKSMGILNRDEGRDAATPGIIKFTSPEQAAGYFMLGETTKTSASGKDVGKTRSPFTQPFFPLAHGLQSKRFSTLAETMPNVDLWMMNTGFVGGSMKEAATGNAHKVKIRHSSAMLEALLGGNVTWKQDPDFGYMVVDVDAPENAGLIEKVPVEILNPVIFYKNKNRMSEYTEWVGAMKSQRADFLRGYKVDEKIISAVTRL